MPDGSTIVWIVGALCLAFSVWRVMQGSATPLETAILIIPILCVGFSADWVIGAWRSWRERRRRAREHAAQPTVPQQRGQLATRQSAADAGAVTAAPPDFAHALPRVAVSTGAHMITTRDARTGEAVNMFADPAFIGRSYLIEDTTIGAARPRTTTISFPQNYPGPRVLFNGAPLRVTNCTITEAAPNTITLTGVFAPDAAQPMEYNLAARYEALFADILQASRSGQPAKPLVAQPSAPVRQRRGIHIRDSAKTADPV